MTDADLRTKVRDLMAAGVLPVDPPPITRPVWPPMPGNKPSRTLIGGPIHKPCTVCGEPGPQVQYFYIAGQVVNVHAACDAIWKQEQER